MDVAGGWDLHIFLQKQKKKTKKKKKVDTQKKKLINRKNLFKTIMLVYWQTVVSYRTISLLGVFLLLSIVVQILTGTMVSFGAINDCLLLPQAREEDDMGDLYNDDFYYYHERGVDFIFIFLYLHLFRKIFLKASYYL